MTDTLSLYALACRLVRLGNDGSPVYSDTFAQLNREVYRQANALYGTQAATLEEEAWLCLALLTAYAATLCDNGNKHQRIRVLLARCESLLPRLSSSLLRARLLLACYQETCDDSLLDAAWQEVKQCDAAMSDADRQELETELRAIGQSRELTLHDSIPS